jgi:large subunit ribosomal protein L10
MSVNVNREKKEQQVSDMQEAFNNHDSFYLIDFVNMPVSLSVQLRKLLRENSYSFRVIKNRLALRAFKEDFPEGQFLQKERFEDIAKLTSKEDLIGKLGCLMAYPLMMLLRTWQAPFNSLGSMLSQLKSNK